MLASSPTERSVPNEQHEVYRDGCAHGNDFHRGLNSAGKLVMESVIETKALTVIQFVQGLRGDLHVTLEEGTWAAWLYDLLRPHVNEVLVCDPRKNALLKAGNKSDRIDARKPAERKLLQESLRSKARDERKLGSNCLGSQTHLCAIAQKLSGSAICYCYGAN